MTAGGDCVSLTAWRTDRLANRHPLLKEEAMLVIRVSGKAKEVFIVIREMSRWIGEKTLEELIREEVMRLR